MTIAVARQNDCILAGIPVTGKRLDGSHTHGPEPQSHVSCDFDSLGCSWCNYVIVGREGGEASYACAGGFLNRRDLEFHVKDFFPCTLFE